MSINLDLFCSIDPGRPALARPFRQGDYAFATNGHICIRVPRNSKIRARSGAPDAAAQFASHFSGTSRFRRLPTVSRPQSIECERCKDGTGAVFTSSKGLIYCLCDYCYGSGTIFSTVEIEDHLFDGRYIALAQDTLPNVSLAFNDDWKAPVQLCFDGGIGLLMPMSRPFPEMPVVTMFLANESMH